ncbi:unnamed protein product [Oncorhynchus mykiss]|uniref:PLAT domain-containing protein n=1 Tax=Oncorhynchus mykiss TaxID=8022 RepID=A0A060WBY3_ONCMY|nr:unnamed protein product [Oncorhynchus mykiss]
MSSVAVAVSDVPGKKEKKNNAKGSGGTEEVDDESSEDQEPESKTKRKRVTGTEDAGAGRGKRKKSKAPEEGYHSDTSEPDVKSSKKKGENKGKDSEEEYEVRSSESKSTDDEDHSDTINNKKKRAERLPGVIEATSKGTKKNKDHQENDMGSKDKKSKDDDRKSKKDKKEGEQTREQGDEEGDGKKKKKKAKKGSGGDSDEDTKKGKGKKKKLVENYVEIYENELRNYEPDTMENYEDEYHKKKVYEVVTITGDERGAGTDANVFITLFGEYGITPKVHLASNTEKRSRTAFEKNKTDVFRIKTHNVGPLKKIRYDSSSAFTEDWTCVSVAILDSLKPASLRDYISSRGTVCRCDGDCHTLTPKITKIDMILFRANSRNHNLHLENVVDVGACLSSSFPEGHLSRWALNQESCSYRHCANRVRPLGRREGGQERSLNTNCILPLVLSLQVLLDDMGNKSLYEFPINRWFAIDEDDGKIQRDILVGGSEPTGIVYHVQVVTGKVRGAGTNSNLHMLMHGTKGLKNSGKIFLQGGKFERGLTDIFNVEISALLSPLSRVTIGHDNGGVSAGWYCEKIVVFCPFTGIEQTFPCSKWLDESEGDGLIERELYEMVSLRQRKQKKHPWSLWIWTSDLPGAGTDASVYFQIYGEKGKSDEMRLDNKADNFEQGQLDKFMVELPDLGKLTKCRIWHEKRSPFAGWHLSKSRCDKRFALLTLLVFPQASLMKTLTKEKFKFPCERWLDTNEDDNELVRELPATGDLIAEPLPLIKYRVTVCTGKFGGSGTDATVFLNLIGDLGDTGERTLVNCKNNVNKFEKGNMDEFIIEAVSIGQVRRVRIGHNGRGGGCGWYLEKVMVREEGQAESQVVEFPCGRWLDRNEDDGQIVRELVPFSDGQRLYNVSYHVSVKTGSVSGGSSNSTVFAKLYGEKGDTSKMMLVVSDNNLRNYFEVGRVDVFTVETFDIGQISRLMIGHNNEGMNAGWFLDSVQIMVPTSGSQYMFPSHRWLCKDEADGKTEVVIYPSEILDIKQLINYEITVVTGDVSFAGTNANVFIQIYGGKGKTEVINLASRSNNYERATTEIFKIEASNVGKIFKVRIGHDEAGIGSGWFLEKVYVKHLIMGMVTKAKKKDDKKKKKKKKVNQIFFQFPAEEETEEVMQEVVQTYVFPCSRWLSRGEEDGELVVELLPEDTDQLEENTYEVCVFTGDMLGAGTDANVYINIYGENGDTGERLLRKSGNLNKFESGQEDVFTITAIELGPLRKLRIRQDNAASYSSWYLDRVEIVDTKDDTTYYFPCNRWLAVDEDDGQIARELVPVDEAFMKRDDDEEGTGAATLGLEQKAMSTTLALKIKTGEKKHAGTDANVFAIIYGEKDDTGIINLKACKTHKNKFEQGMVDEFTVEAVDLGELEKLRIGHDNSGEITGSSFHSFPPINKVALLVGFWTGWRSTPPLRASDSVSHVALQTELYMPCKSCSLTFKQVWSMILCFYNTFQGSLQCTLLSRTVCLVVPYEIKMYTSDVFGAGTDADVFIVLYGWKGLCTQQKHLCVNKRERRLFFERGAEDMFIVELEDVGDVIEKIRIGHDNSGTNPGWHLDRVEIRRLLRKGKGSETTILPCERWLAKSEDDGETVRELVPSDIITEKLLKEGKLKHTEMEVEDALETHTYKVSVRTGDMYGGGTDAKVFLTIYGDLGDTGERKLSKSESNSNKFERGAVDKFSIEAVDLGQVFKIRIRHDNSEFMGSDWYLDQVEVMDMETEEVYMFLCERWLSKKKEDKRIERTFYIKDYEGERNVDPNKKSTQAKTGLDRNANKKKKKKAVVEEGPVIPYHFTVSTAMDPDASTTARVYVIVMGPNDIETERLWLDLPEGKKSFAAGTMENFQCYGTDVGEIKRVELGHNGATPESCWLVDELSVAVPTKGIKYIFQCKCWLAKDRGDGLTGRLFNVLDANSINIVRKVSLLGQ